MKNGIELRITKSSQKTLSIADSEGINTFNYKIVRNDDAMISFETLADNYRNVFLIELVKLNSKGIKDIRIDLSRETRQGFDVLGRFIVNYMEFIGDEIFFKC